MKKFFIVAILAVVTLSSCVPKKGLPATGVNIPSGAHFNVEFLFEVDGVKIYRFFDAGYYRYFSTGNGSFQAQRQSSRSGKTTTYWSDGVEPAAEKPETEES